MKSYNFLAITLMLSSTSIYAADSLQTHDQPLAIEKSSERPNHKAEMQQPMPVPGDILFAKRTSQGVELFLGIQQIAHINSGYDSRIAFFTIAPDGTMYTATTTFYDCAIWSIKNGQITKLLEGINTQNFRLRFTAPNLVGTMYILTTTRVPDST